MITKIEQNDSPLTQQMIRRITCGFMKNVIGSKVTPVQDKNDVINVIDVIIRC